MPLNVLCIHDTPLFKLNYSIEADGAIVNNYQMGRHFFPDKNLLQSWMWCPVFIREYGTCFIYRPDSCVCLCYICASRSRAPLSLHSSAIAAVAARLSTRQAATFNFSTARFQWLAVAHAAWYPFREFADYFPDPDPEALRRFMAPLVFGVGYM